MTQKHNLPVTDLAHDIRHCLFTIRTGILLLRDTYGVPEDSHELFTTIDKDQQQLAGLVEQLISVAKSQSAD